MKFVALLSGGKDSCYNVMKCQEYGHDLVCLANLLPPAAEGLAGEELNSFMYQSAAHSAIPCMAECFGVPLIRREIRGKALVQTLDYSDTEEDEVEDLYHLLKEVRNAFPPEKYGPLGVSCGTIVSTYQRLRVEAVCAREDIQMTPLSYLWQRDRAELLTELCAPYNANADENNNEKEKDPSPRVEALLVKVAGAGLEPYKHLNKTLSQLYPALQRLHERFGLDLCGEGGEYETLVLDCHAFRRTGKRLLIEETAVLEDDEDCR